MKSTSKNLLCVLAALSISGTVMGVGCSAEPEINRGGAGGNGEGGKGSGTAQGGNGNTGGSGEGGGFIPPMEDAGLSDANKCVSQSAAATLAKKPVDIIILIDNSGSMTDEIIGVQKNINVNFRQIIEDSGIDYRVILVAEHGPANPDESVCIEAPLSGIPAGGCAPPPAIPVNNAPKFYHYDRTILSTDSWCRLLETFNQPDQNGFTQVGWKEWLRPDSFKTFIEITDDRATCTASTGDSFNDSDTIAGGEAAAVKFDQALLKLSPENFGTPDARNYSWYSIVGLAPNNPVTQPYLPADPILLGTCLDAVQSGTGYQALSVMTNGLRFPLCEIGSYDAVFKAIAEGVIAGSKVACDFPIPDPPMGQTVDLKTVEVQYTPAGMGAGTKLKKVADLASCEANAFYLDEATKRVYLCPDTCGVVQKDDKAKIDVLFACEVGGAN